MAFRATDLTPLIGSRIDAEKTAVVDGSYARELCLLLEQRGILVFPRIEMSDDEQLSFSRTLGDVIPLGEKGI